MKRQNNNVFRLRLVQFDCKKKIYLDINCMMFAIALLVNFV